MNRKDYVTDLRSKTVYVRDRRYYKSEKTGKYYPSVTTLLSVLPKGEQFEKWLKDVGRQADTIVKKAANDGTRVHFAIEEMLKGKTLNFESYTLEQWEMIMKFKEFFEAQDSFIVEAVELSLVSDMCGFGFTIDIIAMMNGERWQIDVKCSNYLHDTHDFQVSFNTVAYNSMLKYKDKPIERCGCLWLKAKTRTKRKNMQGKGWQLHEVKDFKGIFDKYFSLVKNLYEYKHGSDKPKTKSLPMELYINPQWA